MDLLNWAGVGIAVVLLYWRYATIVRRRNAVAEALAGIDVQLQQRHDLIPNVLKIARRFMQHESALLNEITALRSQAQQQLGERDFDRVSAKLEAEARLGQQMGRLMMLAENYPELRSDGPMIESQRTYAEVESNLAAARRAYNAAVTDLRNAVEIFPGQLLRAVAGVRTVPPAFEAVASARAPVDAAQFL
jgi:LemA protein